MSDQKYGIVETKESLTWLFDLTDAIIKSLEDGKVSIADAPKFWGTLIGSGKAIGGINQVPLEIAELSSEELAELVQLVKNRFNLADHRLEELIENILFHALQLTINITAIYNLKKAE
jgi:hypothetical protein